jgi:Tfp pilus assembly protein PilF
MLGDLYQHEGNIKKAFSYYEKVLAIDSSNVLVLNNYAYFLSLAGQQLDKAYRMSKKAIAAEPNNATYLDTFGWVLYKMEKYFEAKAIFKHAMIYGGLEQAVILDHYGDVLNALGEKDAAVIYWEMSHRKEANPEVRKKYK